MEKKKHMSLAMQIFVATLLAIFAGVLLQSQADFANNFIKPFGTIFLNLVKFIVVPIVLFSIMCGIISMSDIRKVGVIGPRTATVLRQGKGPPAFRLGPWAPAHLWQNRASSGSAAPQWIHVFMGSP